MTMTLKAQREARIAAKAAAKADAAAAEQARILANPIYAAIAPQRADVVANTIVAVRENLTRFATSLLGTDVNVSAPRARNNMRREEYCKAQARNSIAMQVTLRNGSGWPKYDQPVIGIDVEGIERLVAREAEAAAASFDAYVAKLTLKVGPCDSATVEGSLWQRSTLTVAKGATVERWNTQQILNVSCLGTVFNQWPTRLAK